MLLCVQVGTIRSVFSKKWGCPGSGSIKPPLSLPSVGGFSVWSPRQRPVGPLGFHLQDGLRSEHRGPNLPPTAVSNLPLEVVVQGFFNRIQESRSPGQELTAAAYGLEFQDE